MTKNTHNIQLVEGTFLPAEAADVLFSLITDKIKFHNLQLLNVHDNINSNTNHSKQRIEDLKHSKNMVKDLILKARNEGYELKIDSKIEIELCKINSESHQY